MPSCHFRVWGFWSRFGLLPPVPAHTALGGSRCVPGLGSLSLRWELQLEFWTPSSGLGQTLQLQTFGEWSHGWKNFLYVSISAFQIKINQVANLMLNFAFETVKQVFLPIPWAFHYIRTWINATLNLWKDLILYLFGIHLFESQLQTKERVKRTARDLLSAVLFPRWPQWPVLVQVGARRGFNQVSRVGGKDSRTWTAFCYFSQAISRDTGLEMEQLGLQSASTWDSGFAGNDVMCCATKPSPLLINFVLSCVFIVITTILSLLI